MTFQPKYQEGDLVWVRTGQKSSHEEPAVVVCEFEEDDEKKSNDSEKTIVVVKYTTAGYTDSVESSRLRLMNDGESSSSRRRRSNTTPKSNDPKPVITPASVASSERIDASDNDDDEPICMLATVTSSKRKTRADVTNSSNKKMRATIQEEDEKEEEEEEDDEEEVLAEGEASVGCPDLMNSTGFFVEYSKTSRAACRRCDLPIEKGEMRVGHQPLFRGKQGFVVYRHLHCAVFSQDITKPDQIEGFEKISSKDDRKKIEKRLKESVVEMNQENEELEPDELVPVTFQGEMRPSPKGLAADLLPFQVEGQSWMYAQEMKQRGGILADEMGMGKTIQTIATILDNRPHLKHCKPTNSKCSPNANESFKSAVKQEEELWNSSCADWSHEMKMQNVPNKILPKTPTRAGTLVVCPVIALTQWKSEIEKFCEPNALSVVIYHGPDRTSQTPKALLAKHDVVLTTYQVLEADFRKMVSPNKVKCPNCGKGFKLDKLRIHLKYFCGEGAQRTDAQARQRRTANRHQPTRRDNDDNDDDDDDDGKKKSNKNAAPATKASKKSTVRSTTIPPENQKPPKNDKRGEKLARNSVRRAAVSAKKSLLKTKSSYFEDDSDDDYTDGSSDEEDETSSIGESSNSSSSSPKAKKAVPRGKKNAKAPSSSSDEESERDRIAIAKQQEALDRMKSKKGRAASKKGQLKAFAKKGSKKKFSDDDSSSTDEEEEPRKGFLIDDMDLDAMVEEAMTGCRMSILHSLCWWRIVLDEAHFIKSRSSQTAAAAFALIGIHRWALSGTPLQNRVGEMYSLIRYLRLDPMAHYFCRGKNCDCKSLHYRMMNGKCQDCGHGSVQHFSHFNKHVLNPIQRSGYSGDGRRAMFTLKNEVLDKCLLRRTKETRAEDLTLPPRIVSVRYVRLHPVEEDFYQALYTQGKSSFNDYVSDGTLLNNYAHIFDLLMRMRQAVDHPYLVVFSKKGASAVSSAAGGNLECGICNEDITNRILSSCCQAAFCRSCVVDFLTTSAGFSQNSADSIPCPSCRAPFTIDLNSPSDDGDAFDSIAAKSQLSPVSSVGMPSLRELPHVATSSILRRINLTDFSTSSKIEVLTEELVKMRNESPGSKAIVFSQFVNMLDLIRWRVHSDPFLSDMGLGCRALHGGMDVKARDACLKDFREDSNVRVLLMSLKAGGVALNLTVANYIYLMDPWWNPAAEMQAIDRTHRLGQHRPIRAVRFIAENTVEERILQLQEKKRLVFDGTVGRDAASLKMLTVDDMKSLFA